MKTQALITTALLFTVCTTYAQWLTNSGGTTYYLSNVSYKVGIGHNGSTAASEKLHVLGNILSSGTITGTNIIGTGVFQSNGNFSLRTNTFTRMTVLSSNGNVGIDQTNPLEKLHLNGSIRGDQSGALRINSGTGTVDVGSKSANFGNLDTDRNAFLFNKKILVDGGTFSSYDEALVLQAAGTTGLTVSLNGNVGIGTSAPNEKLTVYGTVYSREVKVDLNVPGPDYVFSAEYALMPLYDLRRYIQKNKHLPEVPSASTMETEGIRLGEMNMLLLKKVEELTLYILEQEERIKKLEARTGN